ncbi:metallophosphoesterase family protein [Palleronia sp. KMU-117]|uniref:metallophosphoesterase family protein n=1 Tax=Palleronia sp. KMU-117 TaxID=3434108 RepID=UPI003D730805
MKCLLVADLHYALKQFDWLQSVSADFDLVVLAGDLLEISSAVEKRTQIVVVRTYLEELARTTRVVVCSGNHDLDTHDARGELVAGWVQDLNELGIVTDWGRVMVGTTLITVCPWWDGPATRDAIGQQLAADAAIAKDRWIWVYHAPPSDSPVSWGGKRHFGDADLSAWIGTHQPDLVLSGHVHQSPFIDGGSWADRIGRTWVFNSGQQIGATPAHVALNLESGEAVWFSLAGAEIVSMGDTPERPYASLSAVPDWLKA